MAHLGYTNGAYAVICPICLGCGRTSIDQMGREVPQPSWASDNTTAAGWTTCSRCYGSGMLVCNSPA